MSHPHSNTHVPMDPGRVHMLDPIELTYWCSELHCTEAQLGAAVAAVGEHVTAVREHLAGHDGRASPAARAPSRAPQR